MSDEKAATIIVPTTGDRGPLLPYSVGSILRQSVKDIEIFIIGDGVNDDTRKIITDMMHEDERIQFFDHPKHERRGEPYRHQALKSARGKIICYLCDRDLMLHNHVERMLKGLDRADMAYSYKVLLTEDGSLSYSSKLMGAPRGLSLFAHTLKYYRKLPFGWRTTPPGLFTDQFMWKQFTDQTDCRVAELFFCSIIYLKRGNHPGLSTGERLKEIKSIFQQYIEPGESDYEQQLFKDLMDRNLLLGQLKSKIRQKFLGLHIRHWLMK